MLGPITLLSGLVGRSWWAVSVVSLWGVDFGPLVRSGDSETSQASLTDQVHDLILKVDAFIRVVAMVTLKAAVFGLILLIGRKLRRLGPFQVIILLDLV